MLLLMYPTSLPVSYLVEAVTPLQNWINAQTVTQKPFQLITNGIKKISPVYPTVKKANTMMEPETVYHVETFAKFALVIIIFNFKI